MNLSLLLVLALAVAAGDETHVPRVPGKTLPEAQSPNTRPVAVAVPESEPLGGPELKLIFAYGSEKKGWIEEVTRTFNDARHKLGDGRTIRVETLPMGSGEIIDRLLKPDSDSAQLRADVVSPASGAFMAIGNGESREKIGQQLINETKELVRSPLVLAMWAELAKASRWQSSPPSWAEVFAAARDPERWKAATEGKVGIPLLRLGHADPEKSNSGLLTLILMVESSIPSPKAFGGGLTRALVRDPAISEELKATEARVVQPLNGSTGFLADSMLIAGPTGMGAALIYESLVIEKNRDSRDNPRLVAIYPKEGVFANEHPIGIVSRDWVTGAHTEAAKDYILFLLARPQQEKAMAHGFRPSDTAIPIDDLFKPELGVAARGGQLLAYPNSQMIKEIRAVWQSIAPAIRP